MQGKESRSAKTKVSIGIDTSKNWLDVHVHPVDLTFRVANTKQGHKTLKRKLAVFDVELIVIEPTGKFTAPCIARCMPPACTLPSLTRIARVSSPTPSV